MISIPGLWCSASLPLKPKSTIAVFGFTPTSSSKILVCSSWASKICPSYELPGNVRAPTMKPCAWVTTTAVFTPNSYSLRALPLPMHSTSGACMAYSLFLSLGRCLCTRVALAITVCKRSFKCAAALAGMACNWRCTQRNVMPRMVRWRLTTLRKRLYCRASHNRPLCAAVACIPWHMFA